MREIAVQASNLRRNAIVACALMLFSAMLAWGLTPRNKMAAISKDIRLESAIPKVFGDWRLDSSGLNSVVNPQERELLDVLYSQTLERTYVNSTGQRVMLSIAYGGEQAGEIEMHRPEVCYAAQGFSLEKLGTSSVKAPGRDSAIPLQRLVAHQNSRNEPISYWMRVGDDIVESGTAQQLSRVIQGVRGWIPDGILFRVSSISNEKDSAYRLHERFVLDLLVTVDSATQRFLVGPVSSERAGGKK